MSKKHFAIASILTGVIALSLANCCMPRAGREAPVGPITVTVTPPANPPIQPPCDAAAPEPAPVDAGVDSSEWLSPIACLSPHDTRVFCALAKHICE